MAPPSLLSSLLSGCCLAGSVLAAIDTQLVGTWSTKSAKVLTGPGFYNPINDSFIEPALTGISYSFTADGYYEEAYYRAIGNATKPSCPQGIIQWQHGSVVLNDDLSLSLTPIAVDGRQLQSIPCEYSNSIYTRYNQSETFAKWQVYEDPYYKVTRLDLYQFDGTPLQPLYLAYSPPQMLPTTTLNPTAAATATAKAKRGLGEEQIIIPPNPLNKHAKHIYHPKGLHADDKSLMRKVFEVGTDTTVVWWSGVAMCILGGAIYML